MIVLASLFLIGGESIRWFVFALLIGTIAGTYSSIFNAAQVLTVWEEWRQRRRQNRQARPIKSKAKSASQVKKTAKSKASKAATVS